MIYMEEYFEMGLESTTIWVEAGEEFGIVFITEEYGHFSATLEMNDDHGLLVQTANYYLQDEENGEFIQFNAWEVDRYTEAYEASADYIFSYNHDEIHRRDDEFTVYIERQESESEAWEITTIEDLMDIYIDAPISINKNVMFM